MKNTWSVSIQHQEETLLIHQEFSLPPAQQEVWGIPAYLIRFVGPKTQLPPPNASANVTGRWILGVDVPSSRLLIWLRGVGIPKRGGEPNLRPILRDLAHLASKHQQKWHFSTKTYLNSTRPHPKNKGRELGGRKSDDYFPWMLLECHRFRDGDDSSMSSTTAQKWMSKCWLEDSLGPFLSYTYSSSSQGHPFQTEWSLGIRIYISTNSPEATLQVSPHSVSLRAFHLTGIDWEPYRVRWSLSISFGCQQVGRKRSSQHQDSKKWATCNVCCNPKWPLKWAAISCISRF